MIKRSRICCEIIPHYIAINDNSQRITLIENLRLSGKDIEFVEVFDYTAGEAHYNTLSDGTVLNVDEEELTNTWLVLVNKSREIINRVSFTDILQRQLHGCPLSLKGLQIDISSSYIMRTSPKAASVGTTLLLLFGISSTRTDEEIKAIQKEAFVDNIAVQVDGSGYRNVYFPDQQSFRNRLLTKIEVVKCDITPDGYISAFAMRAENYDNCPTVTLVDTNGRMVTDKLPNAQIAPFKNGNYPVFFDEFEFDGVNIDWARSFLSVDGVIGEQLLFNVTLTKNW